MNDNNIKDDNLFNKVFNIILFIYNMVIKAI